MGDTRRVPALDGLRGVAVALVVLSHAGLTPAVGGPVGVTVFFVLSGYLITGLLLHELDSTGRVSLRRFWLRRALRLSPPLLVVIAAVGLYMASLGLPVAWRHSAIAATYTENIWLAHLGDSHGPFLNTWSLAMEEQFYLVWPVVVVTLLARRRLLSILALVVAGSLTYGHLALPDVQRAYSSPFAACYALAAGCAVAILAPRVRAPRWVGGVGLAGVLVAAALPVAGADGLTVELAAALLACALLLAPPRVLAWRPLVWLGLCSYSVYLWQTPLFELPPFSSMSASWLALVGIPVIVGLAALTRRYVEQPGRRLGRRWGDALERGGEKRLPPKADVGGAFLESAIRAGGEAGVGPGAG